MIFTTAILLGVVMLTFLFCVIVIPRFDRPPSIDLARPVIADGRVASVAPRTTR